MMKSKKGISMVELVITIIILIIIAGVAIISGTDTHTDAKLTELYAEMKSIQESITYIKAKLDNYDYFELTSGINCGTLITPEQKNELGLDDEEYYILYSMDDPLYNEQMDEMMAIGPLKRNYIVNYDNLTVQLTEEIKINNKTILTYEDVKSAVQNINK